MKFANTKEVIETTLATQMLITWIDFTKGAALRFNGPALIKVNYKSFISTLALIKKLSLGFKQIIKLLNV
ncbi:hypothetical protein ACHRVZ_15740 [Flavobacterium sp. FlaQc-57]|uniref:hypothetical protein n=1 Tax=Flavobacterium sp. FlaQc-57 TaxID=3374186 RepID=UPI0037568D06